MRFEGATRIKTNWTSNNCWRSISAIPSPPACSRFPTNEILDQVVYNVTKSALGLVEVDNLNVAESSRFYPSCRFQLIRHAHFSKPVQVLSADLGSFCIV